MNDASPVLALSFRVFSPCCRYLSRPGWILVKVRKSAINLIHWWYSVVA